MFNLPAALHSPMNLQTPLPLTHTHTHLLGGGLNVVKGFECANEGERNALRRTDYIMDS